MSGNVSQWCWDWFDERGSTDPRGPATGAFRMVRGGNWAGHALYAACAMRVVAFPTLASTNVGFRLARTGDAGKPAAPRTEAP